MPKADEEPMDRDGQGKFKPKKWKQVTQRELSNMAPQERSKYLAYEEPPKHVAEAMAKTKTRLTEKKKLEQKQMKPAAIEEQLDKEKHSQLIGQLKAAEARNRLRVMRLRYQANRAEEVKHLIACQPTSLKAVRLQALVPPYQESVSSGDALDSLQRERVETILEDEMGITVNRDLS
ncbi:protein LKAAEAR1-like [Ptychodera flava]|uniref:protein LKAAEAR1-like n=1 Tax=Ptychodera flava TaxID=63121 RepID=UPI00396A6BB5